MFNHYWNKTNTKPYRAKSWGLSPFYNIKEKPSYEGVPLFELHYRGRYVATHLNLTSAKIGADSHHRLFHHDPFN